MKLVTRRILYTIILLIILAAFLAFIRTNKDMCSLNLNTCLLKSKVKGFWGELFANIGCVFQNLWCVVKSFFA